MRHLTEGGPPAGLLPGAEFDQARLRLHTGDMCLLVTDGVTEALEGDAPLERELEASRQRDTRSAAELCQAVMARALSGPGPLGTGEWDDDRTVVVVNVLDQPAERHLFTAHARTERELVENRAILSMKGTI
jgi:sigma-B regulation protein RsbU (phosphoserine phosphatase)